MAGIYAARAATRAAIGKLLAVTPKWSLQGGHSMVTMARTYAARRAAVGNLLSVLIQRTCQAGPGPAHTLHLRARHQVYVSRIT